MTQKTKKYLRWFALLFSVCLLLGFFSYSYLTKCIFGASSFSRYNLFCYLCVNSNIRNFSTVEIIGQPKYFSNTEFTDGAGYYPPSDIVILESAESTNEIKQKAKEYFESLGFVQVDDFSYEGASFVGYQTKFAGNNSSIEIEIKSNNTSPNDVRISESFSTKE